MALFTSFMAWPEVRSTTLGELSYLGYALILSPVFYCLNGMELKYTHSHSSALLALQINMASDCSLQKSVAFTNLFRIISRS